MKTFITRAKKEMRDTKALIKNAELFNNIDTSNVDVVLKNNKALRAFNRVSGLLSWAIVVDGIGNKRGFVNTTASVVGLTIVTAIVNHKTVNNS